MELHDNLLTLRILGFWESWCSSGLCLWLLFSDD